jgi:hypothetical protein
LSARSVSGFILTVSAIAASYYIKVLQLLARRQLARQAQ